MRLLHWIILMKVVNVAIFQQASVTYQWPVCHKTVTYETEHATGWTSDANNYVFEGSFSSVPCTPISFDNNVYTHMDLDVISAVTFTKLTLSVFINPSILTGVIFHYRSTNHVQEFLMFVNDGRLGMMLYDQGNVVSRGKLDLKSITLNHWFFVALIIKSDSNIELQLQLRRAPQTRSESATIKSYPLHLTGQIRIGSMFEQVIYPNGSKQGLDNNMPGFQGLMVCVQIYDVIFQTADYANAIRDCQNANFPDPQLIPSFPVPSIATTPPTICSHYGRDDMLFTRVLDDRELASSVNLLRQIRNTSLRKCAVHCVSSTGCVSFTITKGVEEYKTCRLFSVYNTAYVTINFETNLYVINVCR